MATSHSEPPILGLLLFAPGMNAPSESAPGMNSRSESAPGMNAPSESATTATGYQEVHAREQARLVDEALRIG